MLLKIMLIRVVGPRTYEDTFALLDDGSTITLIDEKLTRDIGVRCQSVNLFLQGINNEKIIVIIDHALKILSETNKFLGDHWEVGLLWKENCDFDFDSYTTAWKRLVMIERRLDRDPNFATQYYKETQRFIDLGYAVKVDKNVERSKI